jgi:hypothetical protein
MRRRVEQDLTDMASLDFLLLNLGKRINSNCAISAKNPHVKGITDLDLNSYSVSVYSFNDCLLFTGKNINFK